MCLKFKQESCLFLVRNWMVLSSSPDYFWWALTFFFVFLFNNLCPRRHSCLSETSQLWIPARHVCLLPCPLRKGWMGHTSSLQGGHVSSSRPTQKLKRWIWVCACTRTIGHTNQKEDPVRNAKAYVSSHHPPKNHYNIPICNVARMLGRKEGNYQGTTSVINYVVTDHDSCPPRGIFVI